MFSLRRPGWRSNLLKFGIGIGSAAALCVEAETVTDALLNKVRAGIVTDVADLRGIACMESVERTRYAPRRASGGSTCADLVAAAANTPRGALQWRSRLRLDVTSGAAAEQFSLVEVSPFEHNDVGSLLSAASAGSGEFGPFLRNIAAAGVGSLQPRGPQQTSLGSLMAFGFTLPPGPSGVAYRGSVFTVSDSGGLRRLTLEVDNVGDACRVQYTTDYAATRIGDAGILAPQSSTMETISKDGMESRTETYYSGCRRPVAVAVPSAPAAPKPVPPNVHLRVRFQPSIESGTAATGDPVTAVIRTTVKDKQSGVIVHAGDRLHGRIALIEQYLTPQPHWNIAIIFETIERGVGEHGIDQGVEQAVTLVPLDEAATPEIQKLRPPNGTYFTVGGTSAVLDQRFETEWETR